MSEKKKIKLLTKVASGVAFGDTSNSAVRNILTQISKELYGKLREDMMEETLDFFDWRCPYTGVELKPLIDAGTGYAADHIYPQNREWCGLNVQGNLILVTKESNSAKKGLDVETFLLTDTKVLTDIDKVGRSRKERLDKIRVFQKKFKYDPQLIREIVRPMMEERYKLVREEQEECIKRVLLKLEGEGIKPLETKPSTKTSEIDKRESSKGNGYTYGEKIKVAAYYLRHSEGLVQVEENFLHLTGRNGATAKYILNLLGVDTSKKSTHKGLLLTQNLDDEIKKSTGVFKSTLEEIKNRGL